MTKVLGPSEAYTDILDKAITHKLETDAHDRRSGKGRKHHPLRPSSAGACSRKLAIDLMVYRDKGDYQSPVIAPNIYRLFELGHAIEYHTLRNFRLVEGLSQRYKQQVLTLFNLERGDPSLPTEMVEGSCDYTLFTDEHKGIGDVKSKKDGFSSFFKTKWDQELDKFRGMESLKTIGENSFWAEDLGSFIKELGSDFLVDNLVQLNLYSCSEFMVERGIDHGFLYRYNKNDSRHMEIRFKPSMEVFDEIRDKFNRINVMVDQDKIPETCDFIPGTMRAAFCECHKMYPYSETDPLKLWFKTAFPRKKWPKELRDLRSGKEIEKCFGDYFLSEKADKAEKDIIQLLQMEGVSKVKLQDGKIYEVKHLKSPRPHFELRRGKL